MAALAANAAFDVAVSDYLGEASSGKWRNLAKHSIVDFIPPEQLDDWLDARRSDLALIVHMGAISATTEPDTDKILRTNFCWSRDLFLWCAKHGVRLIYASSAATYGDGGLGFDDDNDPGALARLRPLNPYGWSKALFDLFAVCRAAEGTAPPQWAGLKFFNVYGPNEGHKGTMKSVVAQIWPKVAQGETVRLFKSHNPAYPDGGQLRDFVYVRDAVDVIAWLADNPQVNGVYNLGSGAARSFKDLAEATFRSAGREPRIDYIDMPEDIRGQYQYYTEARMERLASAGYPGSSTPLEAGVTDYVQGFLMTADGFR